MPGPHLWELYVLQVLPLGFVQVPIQNLHVASNSFSRVSGCLFVHSSIQTIDRELYNQGVKLFLFVTKHLHSQLMWYLN